LPGACLLTLAAFLSVLSSLLVGLILVVAPWTPLWDANYLLQPHPWVRGLVLSAFTRGAVTGLGIVNILLALHEAHQHLGGAGDRI
jgi:hypothetical protein